MWLGPRIWCGVRERVGRVRRATIIMASASGTLAPAIARLVAAGEGAVREVIHRFNEIGLAAAWTFGGREGVPAGSALRVRSSSSRRPPRVPASWGARSPGGACASWPATWPQPGPDGAGRPGAGAADRARAPGLLPAHPDSPRGQVGAGPYRPCGGVPHRSCWCPAIRWRVPAPTRGCRRRAARTADSGRRRRDVPRPAVGEAAGRPTGGATSSPGPADA